VSIRLPNVDTRFSTGRHHHSSNGRHILTGSFHTPLRAERSLATVDVRLIAPRQWKYGINGER
jgi:hypothetical protein